MTAALKIKEKIKVLHSSLSGLKAKALEDGSVYFEGWANKAVVDRGRDLITKKEWKLDNYKKNSIVLFNHDHSKPVGKMISVEAKEDGLYVKGRISNSKDKDISRVRDLVEEGILNSLSVGIMVGDEEKSTDGINMCKNVELHEVSIVAVPMNQDSQFSIATKALNVPVYAALSAVADASGHKDVVNVMKYLELHNEALTMTDSVDYIAENLSVVSGIEKEVALEFLRLKTSETPSEVAHWMIKAEIDHTIKSIDGVALHAIQIPKASAPTREEAMALADGTDWTVDMIEESETAWTMIQAPMEDFEGEMRMIELGNGLVAILGSKKEAAAVEEPVIEEEKTEDDPIVMDDPEEPKVADEKGLLDEAGITTPTPEMNASLIEVNPALDQMKQTNILLATMVSLLQQLSEKMDMMSGQASSQEFPVVPVIPTPSTEEGKGEYSEDDQEEELVKTINAFVKKTNEALSQLGL